MNQILQDQPMTIFGDGSQTRAFTYIGDVAPIIAAAIDTPEAYNKVFNIGADEPYTVNDLARAVARAMGAVLNVVYLPARNEVSEAFSSHEKLVRMFGERRCCELGEGLRRMAAWARKHGARTSQRFENIEIEKYLPEAWQNHAAASFSG
jgi:UDP-glucose 4-epimerase